MRGQKATRNGTDGIKLVRISPYDSRTVHGFEKRKSKSGKDRTGKVRYKERIVAAAVIMTLIFACFGAVYFLMGDGTGSRQEISETLKGKLSERKVQGPVEVPKEEVVVLADEQHTPRVAIDPGHGGWDGGSVRGDILEKSINLQLALLLKEKVQALGLEAVLLREDDDTHLSLEERVQLAQEAKADIYVSIHQNAYDSKDVDSVSGIETWYYGDIQGSRRLAQLIHKGTVEKTGARDRELRNTDELYVIREAAVPACLIETGFLSNEEECMALASPEYQEKVAAGIAQGIDYYFNPKTMYLTFDDGPSEENTAAVLDILKAHDIKATFFLVGENVAKHPEMAQRIVEEGHTVGIHCYRHDYKQIYASVDAYLEDFQKAYDIILETTGVEVQLFRFPGGSINNHNKDVYEEIIARMTENGYIYFDWNASLEDAVSHSDPEQLVKNGVESTRGRKKVVMLCHDIVYNTTQCLEDLLDSLPEYKMEPLTPDVKPIQF